MLHKFHTILLTTFCLSALSLIANGGERSSTFFTVPVGKSVTLTKVFGTCDGDRPPDYWQLKTHVVYPLQHGYLEVSIPYEEMSDTCKKPVPTRYLIYSSVSEWIDIIELQLDSAKETHFVVQVHR
ncbi:MAG: hypothetical protein AAF478_05755 [Pseudomonadota bacterium]